MTLPQVKLIQSFFDRARRCGGLGAAVYARTLMHTLRHPEVLILWLVNIDWILNQTTRCTLRVCSRTLDFLSEVEDFKAWTTSVLSESDIWNAMLKNMRGIIRYREHNSILQILRALIANFCLSSMLKSINELIHAIFFWHALDHRVELADLNNVILNRTNLL